MRIAVWHDLPAGGARRALNQLSLRLAKNHQVRTYQLHPPPPNAALIEDRQVSPKLIRYEPHPPRRFLMYWNDWLAFRNSRDLAQLERRLAEEIDRDGFDVALVSATRAALAPAIARSLNTTSIYYCHEPPRRFYEKWCRPQASPMSSYERLRLYWRYPTQSLLNAYFRSEDIRRVRAASVVLTNSEYSKSRIEQVYGRAARVSYLGVDGSQFQPGSNNQAGNLVLSVGRFEAHKGFEFLVRALARIPAASRPRLALAGAGGHPRMQAHLRKLAESLGVDLEIYSEITDAKLASLYRSARLFLFAARAEPFGLVILEAMASGLPVVAVNEGGVGEIVVDGETGYLTPRNTEAFAEGVSTLFESRNLCSRMGKAARAEVLKRWTWDQAATTLELHLLVSLVNRVQGQSGVES